MNNIHVKFTNNQIKIGYQGIEDPGNIQSLWNKIRENYLDWAANVRLKTLENGKSIAENLLWQGMSTWWINPLVRKDPELSNRWLNRLMILYLCNEIPYTVDIETDDKTLVNCLYKNFPKQSIVYLKPVFTSWKERLQYSLPWIAKFIRLSFSFFRHYCFLKFL